MKMLRSLTLLALVLCAVAAFSVDEHYVDDNELLSKCSSTIKFLDNEKLSSSEMQDAGWCLGYVNGVADGMEMATATGSIAKLYCIPEGVTTGQAVRVLVKWLRSHPEKLHQSRVLVVVSWADAFPCK
ncbi:MAG: Rap1a/Tai family immunity protein [Terracidiphilus sp.]|jgi:hypothetical protein